MSYLTKIGARIRKALRKGILSVIDSRGSWWGVIRETYPGAWQNNATVLSDSTLSYFAVFACITLIASDVAKLPFQLSRKKPGNIWEEIDDPIYAKILIRPNRYQNFMQFKESWVTSKCIHGNAFALKERDGSGRVVALYILDPSRVQVLVTPSGSVFYELNTDNISGIEGASVTVPASEVVHDRFNTLFHPLVGLSPLYAAALGASQGLQIQNDGDNFFANGAKPSGILTAPGSISDADAAALKARFETLYGGDNAGKVAVLGDGLTYEQMRMTAVDAQLLENLKFTATVVCSAFHVPPWKIGIEKVPSTQNPESLNTIYYSDCLQSYVQSVEVGMTEGLELIDKKSIRLDLDFLFRMDTNLTIKTLADGIKGGIYSPNEARGRVNLPPQEGGESVYLQQQNFSLAALAMRDSTNPLGAKPNSSSGTSQIESDDEDDEDENENTEMDEEKALQEFQKQLSRMIEEADFINA